MPLIACPERPGRPHCTTRSNAYPARKDKAHAIDQKCVATDFVFWPRRRLRVLTDEEARLLEHFRTLSESDRVAMRYLTNAFMEVSRF
jgi:hypothetical protein